MAFGYSDEEIRRVREASSLKELFAQRGALVKRGGDFWCCCPFHHEKTPSLKIDDALGLWHCFGCGAGGDAISFVERAENMNFVEALEYLAERAHIPLQKQQRSGKNTATSSTLTLKQLCKDAAEFYHCQLMRLTSEQAQAARDYLSSRQLGGDIPRLWNLGFAPGNGTLVSYLRSKSYSDADMIAANVALKNVSGVVHDRFFNRIMFPICDVSDNVIAFGGRVIGSGQPKYLNTSESPLFHKSRVLYGLNKAKTAMSEKGEAIVVEGYTDVIALHQSGITHAVATLGTALTSQHINVLSRYAKCSIVYLFDGDNAGQHAIERALQFIDDRFTPEAGAARVQLKAVTLPDNLDPAEFVAAHGGAALDALIAHAQPLLLFGIERRLAKYNLENPWERTQAFSDALSILAPIKHSLLAKEYVSLLADRCNVRTDDALKALAALRSNSAASSAMRERTSSGMPPSPGVHPSSHTQLSSGMQSSSGTFKQANASVNAEPYAQGTQVGFERRVRFSQAQSAPGKTTNRARIEFSVLCILIRKPDAIGHAYEQLQQIKWSVEVLSQLASFLCEEYKRAYSMHTAFTTDVLMSALSQHFVSLMPRLSQGLMSVKDTDYQRLSYLFEELAIGDLEDKIINARGRIKQLQALGENNSERDQLFCDISSMQKELFERKLKHQQSRG